MTPDRQMPRDPSWLYPELLGPDGKNPGGLEGFPG